MYQNGLPVISVSLPSRRERCQFTLKPLSDCVGVFLQQLQAEDRGIDRVAIYSTGTSARGLRTFSPWNVQVSSCCQVRPRLWVGIRIKSCHVRREKIFKPLSVQRVHYAVTTGASEPTGEISASALTTPANHTAETPVMFGVGRDQCLSVFSSHLTPRFCHLSRWREDRLVHGHRRSAA